MDALDQGHRCGRCQGESEEGVDPVAPKKSFVFFFLFQKKMNGKELAEMWNNMEEEGTNMYREEEGGRKRNIWRRWRIFVCFYLRILKVWTDYTLHMATTTTP